MNTSIIDPEENSVSEIENRIDHLYKKHAELEKQALTYHLLSDSQIDLIKNQHQQKPEDLFGSETQNRPLVVALFGGTGVGKSTLLNRIAGQEIARTGIERPTSREVTLFMHRSVEIKKLPDDFPVEKVNIRQHQDEAKKEILLIDMPDIDSVESDNLKIVRDWLPYIDILIYVVSPERYRDDCGWRFLLDEGYQHGWFFVINQWQQGDQKVMVDFESLLKTAGFDQPLIFRTDCLSEIDEDEFDQFSENLIGIANDHTINELARRGVLNRLGILQSTLEEQIQLFGKREWFDQLDEDVEKKWSQSTIDIRQHCDLPIQKTAAKFTQKKFSLFDRFRSKTKDEEHDDVFKDQKIKTNIWDERSQSLVLTTIDNVILDAAELGLPPDLFREQFDQLRPVVKETLETNIQKGLELALANPGNRLHRFVHQILGLLTTFLPVAALVWIAYRVINVFYVGTGDEYLGINFAIHSFLLVFVAWLIPFLLHKRSRPSLQKAARKGLNNGLNAGLAKVEAEMDSILVKSRQIQNELLTSGEVLLSAYLSANNGFTPKQREVTDVTMSRMLQKELHSAGHTPKIRSSKNKSRGD